MLLFVSACRASTPIERVSVGDKAPKSSDLSQGTPGQDPPSERDPDDNSDGKIEYPLLSFRGVGYTTYKMNERLSMSMGLETKLDDNVLTIETRTAKVDCGGKSGCDQSEVDRSVQAYSIGANTYQRVSSSELRSLRAKGFNTASYGIFVKGVEGKNGIKFSFDKPLPVYPWPAAKSRYEPLTSGSKSWTATVNADKYIPTHPGMALKDVQGEDHVLAGNARKELNVTMTVSYEEVSSSTVKLTFEMTIADDRERMLYKYFPIPRSSSFEIDTKNKDVRSVLMTSWLNGDKSKKEEESVLDFKLCSKKSLSVSKSFKCE